MSSRRWGWLGVALSLALVSIAGCGAEPNDEATDSVDEALLAQPGASKSRRLAEHLQSLVVWATPGSD